MGSRWVLLDRLFMAFTTVSTLLFAGFILHVALSSIVKSLPAFISSGAGLLVQAPGPPEGEVGGLGPILLNTTVMVVLAVALATPVSLAVGVYLGEERSGRLASFTSNMVQMLSEIPTVLIGLFVFTVVCLPLGGYSLIAGSIALAIAILPFITTQVRESIRSIPEAYREAAYSLGAPRWKTVWLVLVPMGRTGIAAGILLGLMKALGETAPVLLTAGFALYGFYGLTGPSNTLSLVIYRFAQTPFENLRLLAWAASTILFISSVLLSTATRALVGEVKFA
ncbi:MAG: ABC transporter permease subunit [Infirmifilum sp.]